MAIAMCRVDGKGIFPIGQHSSCITVATARAGEPDVEPKIYHWPIEPDNSDNSVWGPPRVITSNYLIMIVLGVTASDQFSGVPA